MEKVLKKIKIISPEEAFKRLGNWLDKNKKTALITALVVGILTHVILLSVMIMSPDGLWNSIRYSAGQTETESGRWLINIIDSFRKNLAIPTITTIISIIVTAINAMFIVDLLNLKSRISVVFTSVFLVVSPCLAMTLLYSYTADAYCYAFLFATLAVWCIYREKHKIAGAIGGAIFTMLTLALYQSYIGAIVGMCMLKPIVDLIRSKQDYKKFFQKIGISILVVIIGVGLYWISEQIALAVYGTTLSTYNGANDIGIMNTLKNLPSSIYSIYRNFYEFFLGNEIVRNPNMSRDKFYLILFIVVFISALIVLATRKNDDKKSKIIDTILIIVATALLPVGLNFVVLIAPTTTFYPLNTAHLLLVIPFIMAILECLDRAIILKWVSFVMCFIIAVTYYLTDNASYLAIRLNYNQAYSTTVRIVDRIENTEGYTSDKSWLIVGILDDSNTDQVSDVYFLTISDLVDGPIFHGNFWGARETWTKFLQAYLGISPTWASVEEYFEICGTEEFLNMPIFPEQGSVQEINGVMVVKLTEDVPTE